MFKRFLICIGLLGILLLFPFLMRPKTTDIPLAPEHDKLVIITAHTKSIRDEYALAFRKYYQKKYHKDVDLDFRSPGGTSDIMRYIADRYEANFRIYWESKKELGPWTEEIAKNFANPRVDWDKNASATAKKAAQDAINGWDPSYGCLYYYNPAKTSNKWIRTRPVVTTIGSHVFCK